MTSMLDDDNPYATPSALPYGLPDFTRIREEHHRPALIAGMAEQRAEVEAIAASAEPATVENTLDALERSGRLLHRAATVFFNQSSSDSTPGLEELEEEIAPLLAEHHDAIYLDPRLFARVDALRAQVEEGTHALEPDTAWLLERLHTGFVRAGVRLEGDAQTRLRELNGEITRLETVFGRLLLAETNAAAVLVTDEAELDGLAEDARASAAQAAAGRGHEGAWLVELILPTRQPALSVLRDRGLRERLHTASVTRGGQGGEHDTRATLLALARSVPACSATRTTPPTSSRTPPLAPPPRWTTSWAGSPRPPSPTPAPRPPSSSAPSSATCPAPPWRPGTGRTTPSRSARRPAPWTTPCCAPTSSSTACCTRACSAPPTSSTACRSPSAPTWSATTPTPASSRCRTPTAPASACSSATSGPATPSAAAPG
jgi:hypothetical protein